MEHGVVGVSSNLSEELRDSFCFCLEGNIIEEGRIEVDFVQGFDARGVFDENGASCYGVDKPRLASDVASVKDGFTIAFKHFQASWLVHVGGEVGLVSQNMTAPGQ